MELLVSTDWLANELGASDLRVVDATKFMADAGRNPAAEYEAGHIPGAVFMDLSDLTDSSNPVENMLPPAEKFASRMQSLGLGDGSRVVLYDDSPLQSAARMKLPFLMVASPSGRPKAGRWKPARKHCATAILPSGKTTRTFAPRPICWRTCTARTSRLSTHGPQTGSAAKHRTRAAT